MVKLTFILLRRMAIQPCAKSAGILCRSLKRVGSAKWALGGDRIIDKKAIQGVYFVPYLNVEIAKY